MATDASLAASRLARALARKPQGIESGLKTVAGGYALRSPVAAKLEDALEVARRRPAEWDLTRRFMPAVGGNLDETRKSGARLRRDESWDAVCAVRAGVRFHPWARR